MKRARNDASGEEATVYRQGNQAAVRHFSKELEVQLKVTSVQPWKTKYLAELTRNRKACETDDLSLPPDALCARDVVV